MKISDSSGNSRPLASARAGRLQVPVAALLLFAIVLWTYLPSLGNGFIEFDDACYVEDLYQRGGLTAENLAWSLTSALAANWHPLTVWSHLLDSALFGLAPAGHHFTSVLLHAINAVLLFLLFRRMTGSMAGSLVAAGFFALHPLRVESVAWISERKDVLSGLFWILTLWAYMRYAQSQPVPSKPFSGGPGAQKAYGLALLFFVLGLMSKPVLVTLPCVLLLLDYWPLKRWSREHWRPLLFEKAPFFALTAVLSALTFYVQKRDGMMVEMGGLPLGARVTNAVVSYARYLGKMIWPADLCALYPHPGRWPTGTVVLAGLVVLAITAFAVARRRQQPVLLIGWLWYLGTFVPMIGVVQVGAQSMADRYSYIPMIGLVMAVVFGLRGVVPSALSLRPLVVAVGAIIGVACICVTRQQIGYWKDDASVWGRAIAVTEGNFAAHYRLGRALGRHHDLAGAIPQYEEALRLKPDFAEGHCSLGKVLALQGRFPEALVHFQQAVASQPNYVVAQDNLGNVLVRLGRIDEGIVHLQKALQLEPNNAAAHANLGYALIRKGVPDQAALHLLRAVELKPDDTAALNNLGSLFLGMGRFDEAIHCFQATLAVEPDSAETHNNLAGALLSKGRLDEAVAAFQRAASLQPQSPEIHRNLGFALRKLGRLDDAVRELQMALQLKPDYPEARNDLATTLRLKEEREKQR